MCGVGVWSLFYSVVLGALSSLEIVLYVVGFFTLIQLWLSVFYDRSLPRGAVGWSAVYDCDIF